ncbi:hypothetical protein HSBAA_61920 [Vreelandella sulfidaeris]|uniref:Uncharacterized protein n=1 Tax=Vreelandella sulfidaeris TaxID=115553 RepID=A0A455UF28_9GAMM|nr:hypothetical protein HSBAA_61920 [Halomonas sulfidaeris]
MGGHVAMGIINLSEVVNFRDELNVLGIATNERSELLEGVPTFTEQGYDLVNGSLRGFIAPPACRKRSRQVLLVPSRRPMRIQNSKRLCSNLGILSV